MANLSGSIRLDEDKRKRNHRSELNRKERNKFFPSCSGNRKPSNGFEALRFFWELARKSKRRHKAAKRKLSKPERETYVLELVSLGERYISLFQVTKNNIKKGIKMTKEQKEQIALLAENLKALRAETKAVKTEFIAALPVGSLKPNGKNRKALIQSIEDQESFKSVGLNEEFRLPTIEDSGWNQKQIDSLNTSLENAVAKRTKLLTAKKKEIAAEVLNANKIHKWKIAAPRNDGEVMKTVVFS